MLHHVELYVGDLERSLRFWTPFLTTWHFMQRR
jgi:catechol 2,3-dioxygenase-like lactoylglutathione lyase family enzyme